MISPNQEYASLRAELLEAKRFVFERPLAIAALAAAGLQLADARVRIALPLGVALLTLFGFWFTVNRLQSASRIAAYIEVILEPSAVYSWLGWETSLREYRIWLKSRTQKEAREYVNDRVNTKAAPDALMYYPAIYYFHLMLIGLSVIAAVVQLGPSRSVWSVASAVSTAAVGAWSIPYFVRWNPKRLSTSIERNHVIWTAVFQELKEAARPVSNN